MHLPKLSFLNGLVVSAVVGSAWFFGWPLFYNRFGQGAADVREIVLASEDIVKVCGSTPKFYIVPWQLGLEDSETRGQLDIGYWIACTGGTGRLNMSFHHKGGPWILDSGTFRMDGFTKTFSTGERVSALQTHIKRNSQQATQVAKSG